MNTIKKYGSWLVAAAMALAGAGAWGATVEAGTADALKDALAAAAEGDTVKLVADIDAPYGYPLATIDKSVTIDLAGKKLTAAGGSYSYGAGVFRIDSETATVTMDDSVGGGAIDTDYSMMFYVNKGNMVFKGGTYSAAGTVILTYAADYSVDLKGGTFIGKDTRSSYRQVILIGGGFLTIENGVTIEQQGTGSYNACVVLDSGDSAATGQREASKLVMNGGHIIASKASYGYAIECSTWGEDYTQYRKGARQYSEVNINGGIVDAYDRYGFLVSNSGPIQTTVNDVTFNFNFAPADSDRQNWYTRTTVGAFSGIPRVSDKVCRSFSKITVNGGTFNFFTRIVGRDGYTGGYGALYSAPYSEEAKDMVIVRGGTFNGLNYKLNFTEGKGMQWWVPADVKMTVDSETGNCVVRLPSVQVAEVTAAQVAEKAKAVDDSGAEIAEPTPEQTAQIEAVAAKLAEDIGKGADLLDVVDSGIAAAGTASGNKYLDITYSEMKVAVGESVVTKEIVHNVKPMVKAPDAEEAVVIPNEEIK